MKTRIQFLDNLRTFMIFLVVLLHAGMIYMGGFESFWLVNDPDQINSLGLINMYIDIFVMFTIFFISGYLIPISLNSKSTKGYIISKFKRIMLPWILAMVTLIPAYKAIFLYSKGLPQEDWYTYFHIFSRTGEDLTFYANSPSQSWLWFLPVLFTFQIMYLIMAKFNLLKLKISMKSGIILTFVLGLTYNMVISSLGLSGWYHSWVFDFQRERLLVYFMVFLLGSLAYKNQVFASTDKNKRMYIISNVVLSISLGIFTAVALNLFFNIIDPSRNYYFISHWVDLGAYYATLLLSMLSFLYVILHTFRFSLNRSNHLMEHLNRSSYQVYIIHMIVMGIFALILRNTEFPAFIKYMILVITTYGISNLLVVAYNGIVQNRMTLKLAGTGFFLVIILALTQTGQTEAPAVVEAKQTIVQNNRPPQEGLHAAIISGHTEVIRQHISAGSDLNIKEPSGGSSPLITAALFGQTEMVSMLLEAGADVNFQNNDGSTALHTAAFFCQTDIVEILLSHGADKNMLNNSGSTALESVSVPFEMVKGIYDYFANTLGPLGLVLDYEKIKSTRPEIAKMLQQ
ncbi:MAG: acyltransferase family protein [Bacteroidetes bacterium]|nr:acyltransferase family protein [Bacteroidota bacterium]